MLVYTTGWMHLPVAPAQPRQAPRVRALAFSSQRLRHGVRRLHLAAAGLGRSGKRDPMGFFRGQSEAESHAFYYENNDFYYEVSQRIFSTHPDIAAIAGTDRSHGQPFQGHDGRSNSQQQWQICEKHVAVPQNWLFQCFFNILLQY